MPPSYFFASLLAMILLYAIPIGRWLPRPWNWSGLAAIGAGVALCVVAARLFGKRGTTIRPFAESSELVVDGPFRITRNPMYLGMILTLVGVGVLLGSVLPLLVIPVFVWTIRRRFILPEEADLAERFGPAYDDYAKRVRRWI